MFISIFPVTKFDIIRIFDSSFLLVLLNDKTFVLWIDLSIVSNFSFYFPVLTRHLILSVCATFSYFSSLLLISEFNKNLCYTSKVIHLMIFSFICAVINIISIFFSSCNFILVKAFVPRINHSWSINFYSSVLESEYLCFWISNILYWNPLVRIWFKVGFRIWFLLDFLHLIISFALLDLLIALQLVVLLV